MRSTVLRLGMMLLGGAAAAGCGGPGSTGAGHSAAKPASAAASQAWSDPSFRPSATVLMTVSLAPVPLTGALADRADQGFERVFVGTEGIQIRMTPAMLRARLNGNREFVQVLNRIQGVQFSPESPAKASLKTLLTGREYEDLRTAVGDPRVLCLPVELVIERAGGGSRGTVLYRAYEFETGRLLRQCRFTAQSPQPVDAAEQKLLVDLILAVADDFSLHFVAR